MLPYVAVPFAACVSKHPPITRQDKLTASPRFLEFCQHQQGRGKLHVKGKKEGIVLRHVVVKIERSKMMRGMVIVMVVVEG